MVSFENGINPVTMAVINMPKEIGAALDWSRNLLILILYHTMTTVTTLYKKPFENIVGKGENAGNQHFLFFPTMFSILSRT